MITTSELKAKICPVFFQKAEKYARRKLDLANERTGRKYGEDGYGDEYLILLTADTVRGKSRSFVICSISAEQILQERYEYVG